MEKFKYVLIRSCFTKDNDGNFQYDDMQALGYFNTSKEALNYSYTYIFNDQRNYVDNASGKDIINLIENIQKDVKEEYTIQNSKNKTVKEVFKTLFSYAYMTEPVSITQDNNTIYQLEDTGKSDYRTLITAEQYSRNLIVSTALYHPVQTPKETATLITSNRSDSKNCS